MVRSHRFCNHFGDGNEIFLIFRILTGVGGYDFLTFKQKVAENREYWYGKFSISHQQTLRCNVFELSDKKIRIRILKLLINITLLLFIEIRKT